MSVDERADGFGREEAGVAYGVRTQGFEHERAERAAEPFVSGDVEAFLAALQDGRRKFLADELAQHVLGAAAVNLEGCGQLRGKLYDAVIEKWRAHFERMRHAHAIALIENVVGQVVVLIDEQVTIDDV